MTVQLTKLLPSAPSVVLSGVMKGVYAAGTTYAPGEVVTYAGGTYIMHTAAVAGTLPTVTATWQAINSPQGYVESIDQLNLVNATTDNTISIDQNGNVGTAVATDGAIHIENTGNTGIGLGVYTNIGATADAPLVYFKADNTTFNQDLMRLDNDGASISIRVRQVGEEHAVYIDTEMTAKAGLKIENSAVVRTGSFGNSLLAVVEDVETATGDVGYFRHDGTGNTIFLDVNTSPGSGKAAFYVDSEQTSGNIVNLNVGNVNVWTVDYTGRTTINAQSNAAHLRFTGDPNGTGSVDGDFWFDGTNLKLKVGTTVNTITMSS